MKRLLISGGMLLLSVYQAGACNVCGCSASNQYLGILPQFYNHFVAVQYQYRDFSSAHPSLFEGKPDERSDDYYNTVQVWTRYNIGSRVQLFGFVPYQHNINYQDGIRHTASGAGDISLLANVLLVKRDADTTGWKQTWLAGGGIKAPTGRNTGVTELDKQGLPNIQPGTGSWDFVVNSNYTIRHDKIGANLDAGYTFTTANRYDYKYGNRLNAGLMLFYWINKGAFRFLPQAGYRYEYTLHDYDNYSRKWLNEQSGGYQAFATAGCQVYYRQLGLQFNYQLPVSQHYGNGYVTAKHRLETGFYFLF